MSIRSRAKNTTKRIGRAFGFSEVTDTLSSINNRLDQMEANILQSVAKSTAENNQILSEKITRLEKINELYFDALFKKTGESDLDMKKRFFKALPGASGDLRCIQQGCIKMLEEMNAICAKNNIPFWLSDGTLLGAVRHGGMIPWDDDVDTYMIREDIHRLAKATDNTDFKVSIAYDPYIVSKQVRFTSKDPANPCFVDIFIFDYCSLDENDTASVWRAWLKKRKKIEDSVYESSSEELAEWRNRGVVNRDEGGPLVAFLDNFFEKTIGNIPKSVHKLDSPDTSSMPKSDLFIVDGLDNMSPVSNPLSPRIYRYDEVFPLQKITYEGSLYPSPKAALTYLESMYGDIYSIPKDLISHYKHITIDKASAKTIDDFINS